MSKKVTCQPLTRKKSEINCSDRLKDNTRNCRSSQFNKNLDLAILKNAHTDTVQRIQLTEEKNMNLFSRTLKVISALLIVVQLFVITPSAAMADNLPAVLEPTGICTFDINECNNPSRCSCPDEYEYNSSVGKCTIEDINQATSRGFDNRSVASSCSINALSLVPCTKDQNPLGYPSSCLCPPGTEYNGLFGQCVISRR